MVVTGLLAGALLGLVLHRSRLCFHSMFAGAWRGRTRLLRGWLLGVGVASVGLSLLYLTPWSADLNTGLAFRPVRNIVGGLVIGVGMVVARSCVSGLLYKLGAGMLGATVGIVGWVAGELAASEVRLGGPTVLPGGEAGTIPGVLGLPRILGALVLLAVAFGVGRLLARKSGGTDDSDGWSWPRIGIALGAATVAGWSLAAAGGSSFGPSTVGASYGVRAGAPPWWLIAFLVGLVIGAAVSARLAGELVPRGETRVRYVQLLVGGFLLGGGGWIAGGCNLGHGLSGAAQLNVSSWVVVAAMAAGVGAAGVAERRLRGTGRSRRPRSRRPVPFDAQG